MELEDNLEPVNLDGVRATFVNERYGEHERNVFDIWIADPDKPCPLVIYIHGGGFVGGDKSRYYLSEDWPRFLKAGISVASINYRYMNQAPYGILASMNDAKRCLQYIRYNAEKYNIDKSRIACTGGSAGAGTSLWLAFSEDMGDLNNVDPVLKESTKISCAGAFATQSTYDIFQWNKIIGLPEKRTWKDLFSIGRAFGFKTPDGINLEEQTSIRRNLDFLNKMNQQSPPFFVSNTQVGGIPTTEDELQHHPLHAKALKEKAREMSVEAVVYAPEIGIEDESGKDLVEFFVEKLSQ